MGDTRHTMGPKLIWWSIMALEVYVYVIGAPLGPEGPNGMLAKRT